MAKCTEILLCEGEKMLPTHHRRFPDLRNYTWAPRTLYCDREATVEFEGGQLSDHRRFCARHAAAERKRQARCAARQSTQK